MTNPLERTWKYEYNSDGDRKSETDPEGNKRTWEYNEDRRPDSQIARQLVYLLDVDGGPLPDHAQARPTDHGRQRP
jgi:YD repeat-containing protein